MAWKRGRQVQAGRLPRPHALIARHARPAVTAAIPLCVAVVTALGVRYAGHTTAGPLDATVDGWVQGRLGLTSPVLTALTWLGDPLAVTLITVLAALGGLLARWWRGAVLAVLAAPVSSVLTEDILKPVIGRTIRGDLSMPSGHTTAVFTLATLAAVLLSRHGARARYLAIAAAYVLAAAVAAAMIAQNFHYFTDVISGAALGVGTVLTAALAIDAAAPPLRARVRRAAAAGTGPAEVAAHHSDQRR